MWGKDTYIMGIFSPDENGWISEENIVKFYYCESEDEYLIGQRAGNFYYAKYENGEWTWCMSRYLPWGEHVVEPDTLWKEYTFSSEPKEMFFTEWLKGFLKKINRSE